MSQFSHYMQLPHWGNFNQYFLPLPPQVKSWLLDEGSLTQRIVKYCQQSGCGPFRVQVVLQKSGRPMVDEAKRLQIQSREHALIREVVLYCSDIPLVFARSVIPFKTLTGKQRILANLGNRSLGAYLFAQPDLKRDPIEIARLNFNQDRFSSIIMEKVTGCKGQTDVPLWARRSVFSLNSKSLMVYEVFLPQIFS